MTATDILAYAIVFTLIVVGWALLIFYVIRTNRQRRAQAVEGEVPKDHIDLYFDEYFPTMINGFDLVTKMHYTDWAASVEDRIEKVSKRVKSATSARKNLDKRIDGLEKKVTDLET